MQFGQQSSARSRLHQMAGIKVGKRMKRTGNALLIVAALSLSVLWVDSASAQTTLPRIGLLTVIEESAQGLDRYVRALRAHGLIVGKNVALELRNGGGDPRQMSRPASELVQLKVDV